MIFENNPVLIELDFTLHLHSTQTETCYQVSSNSSEKSKILFLSRTRNERIGINF